VLIPDHETKVDFLNCEAISQTVAEILKDNRHRALTIGIHGDWGAGKSSILKMVESELSADSKVACLWFNGWTFEGFDDAKTVLIEATITELCRQRSNYAKVKELGTRLLKRVDWLKVMKRGSRLAFNLLTGLPSLDQIETVLGSLRSLATDVTKLRPEDIKQQIEEAALFLKPAGEETNVPTAIHDFRSDFSEMLEEAKIDQLVVLIDDLDRCLPETAIQTLEAIRLFLFVPKTAFVIGADEAMIEYAVRRHFPELPITSGPLSYTRNYLEKLIQIPFRIPALGMQETRTYVTLLLVQSLVGEDHKGFETLLQTAKEGLKRPWLGSLLSQGDVQKVDSNNSRALNEAFVLAQQIGPILAEGTKGNPRQIKRFINTLMVRQIIAKARGFADLIKQPILAKLMLAERFQPDFYEYISAQAMVSDDGKAPDLTSLEATDAPSQKTKKAKETEQQRVSKAEENSSSDLVKWLERAWLKRWLSIDPALAGEDLRPYVFVARDKRLLTGTAMLGDLEALITKLCGPQLIVRSAEPEVKALTAGEADTVFNALRERVVGAGNFNNPPPGFDGLGIVAKHHPRFQSEVVALIDGIEPSRLGVWVVRGWNEIITEQQAREQLIVVIERWANQDTNKFLKNAATSALPALRQTVR
jgi:predicted KAP-like P-loop ATPase